MLEILRNIYGRMLAMIRPLKSLLAKKTMSRHWDRKMGFYVKNKDILAHAQKQEAQRYFARWMKDISLASHAFYTEKTGAFHANYIPDGIYYGYVDQYFNDWELARHLDNKVYYPKMFSTPPPPL